jgi:hypothetical protein
MKQPRIPAAYVAFNIWKNNTSNFLWSDDPLNPGHKQYERLGLTLAEATAWQDETTAWNALWAKYTDKDQKTLSVTRAARDMKLLLTRGGRGIVNRIAANPAATEQDATIFNFVLVRKKPEKPKTVIEAAVFAGVTRIGSGDLSIQARFKKDSKRPSLLPIADGVEYSYKVTSTQPGDPATADPEGEGFRQRLVTKAKFVIKTGTANKGRFILIAFRWVNSKYPELAGPWSEIQVMVLI